MSEMTINITDSEMEQIQELALQLGKTPEGVILFAISHFLLKSDDEIKKMIENSVQRHVKALKRLV